MLARLFDNPVAVVMLVLIIVVVFGWKRLPDAARSLGRSTRILKSELDSDGESKASKETVQGEATQQAPGSVPGESSAPPPSAQNPSQQSSQGPAHGQTPPQGQQGGPQAS